MLGDLAGGAVARPFVTHHNALGQDLYLRIATELHLKRLVVGGLERVYEIGRNFRNEGVSTRHNPEFTSIEVYQAYANYADMMDLTEECISDLVDTIHDRTKIPFADKEVDFARPWRRAPIAQLVAEHLGIKQDITGIASVEQALAIVENHCVTPDTPLHVCLREMTDADAEHVVPGLEKGTAPLVERAKAAFKNAKDKHAFYTALGKAMDQLWASPPSAEPGHDSDEITLKGRPAHSLGVEVTNPGVTVPTAPAKGGDLEDDTGEIPVGRRTHDAKRACRRACSLSLLYAVFDHEVERTLINPTFITDFSVSVSPLARRRDSDPALVDRFELIIAGMELANAFSELNDPIDQRGRFEDQLRDRERGDNEAHEMDEDYLRALEVGLPPTAGLGIGIDRLVMVLTNQQSIRDVILFPQMRRAASTGT
jgi:lysyl-tRNA synthetase class II